MKRISLILTLLIFLLCLGPFSTNTMAQSLVDYTATPPFVGTAVPPNVLLLMDNSGSMNSSAYHPLGTETYNSLVVYGGYFDTTKCYSYAANLFSPTASAKPCGSAGQWDGNFLNWVAMRRIEISKWVMMGGKCAPRSINGNCYPGGKLTFESPLGWNFSITASADGVTPYNGTRCFLRNQGSLDVKPDTNCNSANTASLTLKADVSLEPQGVIQEVGNKARFGLMEFKGTGDGGKVLADVGGNLVSMVNAIENTNAATWTPLSESLYEATRYFAQIPPAYANSDYSYTVQNRDPYYFRSPDWMTPAQYVPCCKSFVIIFTDGQPTQDLNIPDSIKDYAHTALNHGTSHHCGAAGGCTTPHSSPPHTIGHPLGLIHNTMNEHHDNCSGYYGGLNSDACNSNGSHYLDDVAYWAHITDLRPETGNIQGINAAPNTNRLTGMQNLTVYTFFAFGTGANILKDTAKAGGFNDLNGDGLPGPDPKEWDDNGDGVPDTYFESADAFAMRDRLMAAITDILKRSAAGTSVSILATSAEGEGALYQAYFYPSRFEGIEELKWLGYLRGLFLDSYGNLREDTNGDGRLVLSQDRIIQMFLDNSTNEVKANLFSDTNEDGIKDSLTPDLTVNIDSIASIWEGGKRLAQRNTGTLPRNIYTFLDANNNSIVDSGEVLDFTSANANTLQPYLRATTAAEATNIISFIRGSQVTGYRNRCITVSGASAESGCTGNQRVWKLGDIVYSTPTVVAAPKEQFDLIYGDPTYTAYRTAYKNRRNVVYVGANDGMLHAFNAGVYTAGDDSSTTGITEHGFFAANPGSGNGWGNVALGDELWAFVPYDNLPHLKWLTQTDYTHVYYVDLKPKITDVRIFNDSGTSVSGLVDGQSGVSHPNGWGTILIMGMRLGGGAMNVTIGGSPRTFMSAYYVFDITDPEHPPKLLWRFTNTGLGLTTSYPTIIHFKATNSTPEKWYMTVGSGPDNNVPNGTRGYDGSSNQQGKLFVVDIITGSLLNTFNTDLNAFMGDPTSVDGDLDYNGDVIYTGNVIKTGATTWTGGKTYRLATNGNPDPTGTNWTLSTLFDQARPLLAPPSIAKDSLNNFWVFFGTGRFWDLSDKANSDQQALYGMKDGCWRGSCTTTYTTANLLNTSAVQVSSSTGTANQVSGSTTACGGSATCSYSTLIQTVRQGYQGWYVNLQDPVTPSERVLSPSVILGGVVLSTSFIPNSDICAMLGDSFLYALYYETGTAYNKSVIGTETIGGTDYNKKSTLLGKGMPTTIGVAIGKKTKGFIQTSTGTILEIEDQGPSPRSEPAGWREKSNGGGTIEIEEIYKHIVK